MAITDLGDSSVTGALMGGLFLYLLFTRHQKAAFIVISGYLGAILAITLGKVWLYSSCSNDTSADLRSPSGHAALSFAAYGIMSVIFSKALHGSAKKIAIVLIFSIPIIIAASRVLLQVHTISDIFVGSCVGGIAYLYVWWLMPKGEHIRFNWKIILPATLLVIIIFHGIRLPGETVINQISDYLKARFELC